jgi:shikimate kinase
MWPGAGRLWLTGLMGAGKSTLGWALAAETGWPHVDNDIELEAATGQPLAYWAPGDALHAAEDALLMALLQRPGPFIADVPAGTAERPAMIAALRDSGFVVYLRAPLDVLVTRCLDTLRPLGPDPRDTLSVQWGRRDAVYSSAADLVVDATLPAATQAALVLTAVTTMSVRPSESAPGER